MTEVLFTSDEMRKKDPSYNYIWLQKQITWYGHQIDSVIDNHKLRGIYINTCESYKKELEQFKIDYPEECL